MNYFKNLNKGRIARRPWIEGLIFYAFISYAIISTLGNIYESHYINVIVYGVLTILVALLTLVHVLCLNARRFQDKGKSGSNAILCLVPLVNIGVFIYLCTRGQNAANQYGDVPVKGSNMSEVSNAVFNLRK